MKMSERNHLLLQLQKELGDSVLSRVKSIEISYKTEFTTEEIDDALKAVRLAL